MPSSLGTIGIERKKKADTVKNGSRIHLLTLTPLGYSWGHRRGDASPRFLRFVDIFVGSLQHTGHQGYEFTERDLSVLISIQTFEYSVNGGLIFAILGDGDSRGSELELFPSTPVPRPLSSLRAQLRETQKHAFLSQNRVGESGVTKRKTERSNCPEPF